MKVSEWTEFNGIFNPLGKHDQVLILDKWNKIYPVPNAWMVEWDKVKAYSQDLTIEVPFKNPYSMQLKERCRTCGHIFKDSDEVCVDMIDGFIGCKPCFEEWQKLDEFKKVSTSIL